MMWPVYFGIAYQAYAYMSRKPKWTRLKLTFDLHAHTNWETFCERLLPHLQTHEDMLSIFRIVKQAKIENENGFDISNSQSKVVLFFNIYHYTSNLTWSINAFEKMFVDLADVSCSVIRSNSEEHNVNKI